MSTTWGLSNSVWWNRNYYRKRGCACIILRTGGMIMKGFSPDEGNIETTEKVGKLLLKLIPGGPGMVTFFGY